MTPSTRPSAARRLAFAAALSFLPVLAACDDGVQKPSESNTYNVHLYYGKEVNEHIYLGKAQGISRCRTRVHAEAAKMQLKGNTYSYACCWVNAGEACYQKHK